MKAAIYCRLSEEDRNKKSDSDDSESIQNQKSILLQYAFSQGWEIYSIYSDDDYTGADRYRPEFVRLLQDAEKKKFDIVLCKTQSRFTREIELVEKYIHGLFLEWNIRFIGLFDHADTAVKGNKKSRQINGLVNEWYLEDLSENIKGVFTNKRKQGKHIGSFALYGYRKDPDQKGHLIIDDEAAEVVREVFALFAQGYGKTAIARLLNDRGIPNPTEYKRQKGLRYKQPKSKQSTLWRYSAIADMLSNEIYIGNMVQGKYGSVSYKTKKNKPRPRKDWYSVEGTHEPIVGQELWGLVQGLLRERAKPFCMGQVGLFARKVRCSFCGYTMRSTKHASGRHYLTCSNRHCTKDACPGAFISVEKLKKMVLSELNRLAAEFLDINELEQGLSFADNLLLKKKQIDADIASYEKKLNVCKKGIQVLYIDRINGIISDSEFGDMSQNFRLERERLEHTIEERKLQLKMTDRQMATQESRRQLAERYAQLDDLDRLTVISLVDHISVSKRIPGSYDVPIEIHWNF